VANELIGDANDTALRRRTALLDELDSGNLAPFLRHSSAVATARDAGN